MLRPFCLEQVARALPGGVRTLMHLAWLSRDSKVHTVALRWRTRYAEEDCLLIEDLCIASGIQAGDFVSDIAATALELDPHMLAAFIGGIATAYWRFEDSISRLLDRVPTDRDPTEMPSC